MPRYGSLPTKMADLKLQDKSFLEGAKLPVLIEKALADVLIVCLKYDSKCFRGVLMDANKRNLPHGINVPMLPKCNGKGIKSQTTEVTDTKKGIYNPSLVTVEPEMSALALRHTYHQDVSKLGGKFSEIAKRSNARHFRDKTVRNIRLRPRQVLCSKCKSACHDQGIKSATKNLKDQNAKTKDERPNTVLPPSKNLHSMRTRGRPMKPKPKQTRPIEQPLIPVIDTFPRVKLERLEPSRISKPEPVAEVNNHWKDEVDHEEEMIVEQGPPEIEAAPPPLSAPLKVSPVIKISIGERTVLKIPPRLHEIKESETECDDHDEEAISSDKGQGQTDDPEVNLEMPVLEIQGQSSVYFNDDKQEDPVSLTSDNFTDQRDRLEHRKRKKAMKKAKYREKQRLVDMGGEHSENTHPEKHHKHKKKHKHRHSHDSGDRRPINNSSVPRSPLSSTSFSSDKQLLCSTGDNVSPTDSDENNQKERPRLLYRWRQKDGLPSFEPKILGDPDFHGNSSPCMLTSKDNIPLDNNRNGEPMKQSWSNYSSLQNSPREILSNYSSQTLSDDKDHLDRLSDMAPSDFEENSQDFPGDLPDEGTEDDFVSDQNNLEADFKPSLMMRIQTRRVSKCETSDGRLISVGDIIWGKIQGFPWWPGRVLSISVKQKDNGLVITQVAHVSWFGSSTMSHMHCSDLFPFIEDFNIRYNKKKRGPYKMAIKQATVASKNSMSIHNDLDIADFDL